MATTSSGALTGSRGYRAYGNYRRGGDLPTDYRFTGQKVDASGLVYMNARYYDPMLGQFISPDTLAPDPGVLIDYNRYGYARGNPLKFSDPSGHCATLSSGEADENDGDCWRLANTIAAMWGDTDYWQERFGDVNVWNDSIAPSGATAEFFGDELLRYLGSTEYHAYETQQARQYEQNRIPSIPVDPIDAIAVGGSYNLDIPIVEILGGSGTFGVEVLAHRNGQIAVFVYGGGGISVGAGANANVYVARIRKLSDIEKYQGGSIGGDMTVSLGPAGITTGAFTALSGGVYGDKTGFAPGANVSLSLSATGYFPLYVSR